ncbi:MAG: Transcriptional regulator, AbiEi antitoxin, partial [Ilumatobacteraceae bacterium]|nr:Transcriptional regulator, AbiEi antitoxin [Ilumatobacteraceae bacterium]
MSLIEHVNSLLAAHLSSSDGLVTTPSAKALGVTARQLDGLVRRGELERIHVGVYRSTATAISQRQRLLAGLTAAGGTAVVSHRSALAAQGAPKFSCS